ncbi:hypothetical protein F939_00024 [Acinetobacter radioresistens DSM 6976 = NBRC 102413 = CIP 103788]|uniref:hypothetical protein n=1 Tax=Acinetobacter TaxID=469 RepID=UPI00028D461E|nr:hypothetical protein [Acinetobacter radioresistens]ENV91116.1 hypothetical protein F939_00024 [Acinetobacter radioresistens DSM 6976 = NBRC 102413 = CIP 103788]BBL22544.1 hypothetical protein ACRAD_32150 [Acinetobacter radioresistens DSM 6976 = NBRC 102413 = CIP 103788]
MMNKEIVSDTNVVKFPRPCTLCDDRENVQFFAGLMLCEKCQENIRITNPNLFAEKFFLRKKRID